MDMDDGELRHTCRGFQNSDQHDFSKSRFQMLLKAGTELSFLLDHGYPRDSSITFVSNHYQFTERQRLLLARGISGHNKATARRFKKIEFSKLAGQTLLIDGFNEIIPLEVALNRALIIFAQDGTIRDLAGLSGTYHPIEETPRAIELLLRIGNQGHVKGMHFYLDAPVSNSGRLAHLITEIGDRYSFTVKAELVPSADRALKGLSYVASNDSAVIDHAVSWISLDAYAVQYAKPLWSLDVRNC